MSGRSTFTLVPEVVDFVAERSPDTLVVAAGGVGDGRGDDTVRTRVYDVVRRLDWPAEYNARALGNVFLDTWHGHEAELSAQLPQAVAGYEKAVAAEDFDTAAILTGEGVGRVRDVRPAADIAADVVTEAARILNRDVGA